MSSGEEEDSSPTGESDGEGAASGDKHNKYKFHYGVVNLTKERNLLAKPLVRKSEKKMSWIAINTIDYYNKLIKLWPPCEDVLKNFDFPMRIRKFEFLWKDDENYPVATKIPSAEYIRLSFQMIRNNIQNEDIFVEVEPFPKIFKEVVKEMFKKMFRIYGHFLTERILYDQLLKFKMATLCKTIFKHLMSFAFEFRLLKKRDIIPMNDWILENMGESYREKLHIVEKKKKKKKHKKSKEEKEEKRRKKEEKRKRKEEKRRRKAEEAAKKEKEEEVSIESSTMIISPPKQEEIKEEEEEDLTPSSIDVEKLKENEENEEHKEEEEEETEKKEEEVKEGESVDVEEEEEENKKEQKNEEVQEEEEQKPKEEEEEGEKNEDGSEEKKEEIIEEKTEEDPPKEEEEKEEEKTEEDSQKEEEVKEEEKVGEGEGD